jgi:hypothetical protein
MFDYIRHNIKDLVIVDFVFNIYLWSFEIQFHKAGIW